ncbi:unnamed protein product, partial [Iphiclides podalirius]
MIEIPSVKVARSVLDGQHSEGTRRRKKRKRKGKLWKRTWRLVGEGESVAPASVASLEDWCATRESWHR